MHERTPSVGVILLAGGEATRLPGKLFMDAGDLPLLVRVYRNVSAGRTTVLSCKGALPYEIDLLIDAPAVVDRWPLRGPLSGLLSTMSELRTPWVFAVAGDAPFVDAAFIDRLEAQIEALSALYARAAFLREGMPVLLAGDGKLRMVIDRLKTRYVDVEDDRMFANVNTPAEYDAVRRVLS